ncbi:hypothetical protein R6Q59_019953 [Mikania micrantha]
MRVAGKREKEGQKNGGHGGRGGLRRGKSQRLKGCHGGRGGRKNGGHASCRVAVDAFFVHDCC